MPSSMLASLRAIGQGLWRRLRRTQSLADPPYAGVIREAERCQVDAERAAAFRKTGGLERLAEAIEAAETDGHAELAARGRTAQRRLSET